MTNSSALRVVHSYPNWLPATQIWLFHLVKFLPRSIESHVLCERTANLDRFMVPRMHVFNQNVSSLHYLWYEGLKRLGLRQYPVYFLSVCKHIEPQIIHSHFGKQGWMTLQFARGLQARQVVTFYGHDVNSLPANYPVWRARYKELFSEADLFLCEGSHMAACLEQLGCPRSKIRIHHLGVDLEKLLFKLREWNSKQPVKVLIAATFTEKKGIPYAIEALGILKKEYPVEITIIGDAQSDNPQQQLEKQRILKSLEQNDLMQSTTLLGYQPYERLLEEAYKHHLFLSPSVTSKSGDTEGGAPVTITEMAAMGMPVISTKHCDIPEVLDYGTGNWLAEERDIEGIVQIIRTWLGDPGCWPARLARARQHVEAEYEVVKQGQRLAEIYRTISKSDG